MDELLELHDVGERHGGMLPANTHSNVYENSRLIKGGEGVLVGFYVYNSGAAQFIQLFDAASLPADGAIPEVVFPVAATSGVGALWAAGEKVLGRTFRSGIVICNSSTAPAKTIGAADCFFDCQYV